MTNRYAEAGNLGHTFIWEQRWDDAVKAFTFAIQGLPKEANLYDGLATSYRELGDLDMALTNYQQAARLSNGDPIYLEQVADVQQRLGLFHEAAQTYLWIGEIRMRENRLDDAMDKWLMAARLDNNLLKPHERLAAVFEKQGKSFPALTEYMEVARLYEAQGDVAKALQACQKAIQMDPRNPDVLTALELLQSGQKAFQNTGAGQIGTDFAPSSRMVDLVQRQQRRTVTPVEDALRISREQMAEAIFSSGEDESGGGQVQQMALISQALDYQTRGLVPEAINSYEKAIQAGLENPAAAFNLGLLYQERLRFDEAIEQLQVSARSNEYRLASHFALGESYRAQGKVDKAIEHFIQVLKIVDLPTVRHDQADRLIELYENLADSLIAQGERDKATAFSNTLVEFLSHRGWEDKVKTARHRLDALSAGKGTMILGDILSAGSSRVLESLFLAQEHARRGLYNSAIEEIFRAIEFSPTYLPAHLQMGELLIKLQRTEQAVDKFVMIGNTCLIRGDIGGAVQAYERAAEISPLDLETRDRLIDLLKKNGQFDQAIEQFINLGESYYQIAQIDRARQTYIDALKLAPRGTPGSNWRARLLRRIADIDLQRFDWRQALPVYRELRRLEPGDERVAMNLIDLLFKVGDREEALKELDRYLIQLAKSGRGAKILGILEDLLAQRPNEPGLVDRLAKLYIQQKRLPKAIELLDQLGEAQLEAGQIQAAIGTIKKILGLSPDNVAAYEQLLKQLKG